MESLKDNWLTEGLIDFEYKKYVLLAYMKRVKESFGRVELYPPCLSQKGAGILPAGWTVSPPLWPGLSLQKPAGAEREQGADLRLLPPAAVAGEPENAGA